MCGKTSVALYSPIHCPHGLHASLVSPRTYKNIGYIGPWSVETRLPAWQDGWRFGGRLSLSGAATSIIFVATKFCRDKSMLYFCRDKIMFVTTKLLSRQIFVAGNTCLSRQNTAFVVTKLRKYHFCRDKTNTCLSRQILAACNKRGASYTQQQQHEVKSAW